RVKQSLAVGCGDIRFASREWADGFALTLPSHFIRQRRPVSGLLSSRGALMSDAYEFDDEAEPGRRKASLAEVAAFMWKHWSSQPLKLALFGGFFGLAVAADLAFPFASARLIEALSAGPTEEGQRAAAAGYALVAATACTCYVARNIRVRFWIPLA